MKNQNMARIKKIIAGFKNVKVMVIGDLILDEFIWGKVDRISPEAPVPVVRVDRESFMPGGASNVANNIATLGGKAELVGVVGADERASILKSALHKSGILTEGIIQDRSRPTCLKTRVIAHKQQVVRIDKEMVKAVSPRILSKMLAYVKRRIKDVDVLIVEDYGKGVITPELLKVIMPMAKRYKRPVAIDPKEENFSFYKGATLITPNADETARATGIKIGDKRSIIEAGRKLLERLKCSMALVTLGEKGMALFKGKKAPLFIPTIAQDVYDVSGAGDTVIGVFSLALASGAKDIEAAHIANCAAGIVVGKVGIKAVNSDELIERMAKEIGK